jgi:hypothetical protein
MENTVEIEPVNPLFGYCLLVISYISTDPKRYIAGKMPELPEQNTVVVGRSCGSVEVRVRYDRS